MIIMQVMGLSLDSSAKTPIVLLQSSEDKRILPIWVGAMEAMSISLALSGQSMPRPLTHDLIISILDTLEANVKAVEIHKFQEGTFYADVLVHKEDTIHRVDCRPSDGIALALRTGSPIAVHPQVLQEAQHSAQQQDGTSFQLLNAEEFKANTQQPAKLMTQVIQNISTKPSVQTNTNTTKDEQELAKLLSSLEPQSQRRM